MNKLEYFCRNLELIGSERIANLEKLEETVYDVKPVTAFSHKDFKIQFAGADELEKALGRQAKNRLMQLAGLIGYYGGWCKNYTESKKVNVSQGADASLAPDGEVALFERDSIKDGIKNINILHLSIQDPTYTPISAQSRGEVDFEDKPQVIYISRTSKTILDIYQTKKRAENAIAYAKECGLIQCVDDAFRFGSRNNRAKRYAWNKVCEHQLRGLMKKHGILVPSFSRDSELPPFSEDLETKCREQELYYKVRIGKGMRTPGLTEQQVSEILSRKHRYVLEPMLKRLAEYNEGRPDAEKLNFRFNIRITNGFNVKNGCRAASIAGGLKKESEPHSENDGEYFEDYFRRAYGDEPAEYDVKGSVPRINRLVNFGVWDDWKTDPYAEMFDGFVTTRERRKIAKSMYMLYEFEQSGAKIKAAVSRKCPNFMDRNGKSEIGQTLEYWYGPLLNWHGDSLGSLVFLYEDAIYSLVDMRLKALGYRFMRKFDCWVFPQGHRPDESAFWKLVERCALEWRRTEYERERTELEFLESAGVKELKRHDFSA